MSLLTQMPPARGSSGAHADLAGGDARRHRGAAARRATSTIKPYVTSDLDDRRTATPRSRTTPAATPGLDVKYGVTQNLTADFTLNTDFAQVEADEQQINLTRFSLFFPEKRDFFLENRGMFTFGGRAAGASQRRRADALLQPAHRAQRGARRCRSTPAAA